MAEGSRKQWEERYFKAVREGDDEAAEQIVGALGYRPEPPESAGGVPAPLLGFGSGALLGWRDEASAALSSALQRALIPEEQQQYADMSYEAALGRQRQMQAEAAENPLYTAGEVVGSFATPGGFGFAARGVSPLMRLARGAASGGAQGGVAAAGYSEGMGEGRLGDAATGAGVGAVLAPVASAALPRVGQAGTQLWQALTDSPTRRAERMIGRELAGEGFNRGDEVYDAIREIGPYGILADVAPGAASQSVQRAGGGELTDLLETRQAGAPGRVRGILADAMGAPPEAYGTRAQALRDDIGLAGQAYEQLRFLPVPRETFDPILTMDSAMVRRAVKDARDAMAEQGTPIDLESDLVPLGFVDALKREFDGIAEGPMGPGSGITGAQAGRARDLARQLRTLADEGVEGYAPTRQRYGEIMGRLEALGEQYPPTRGGRQLFQTTDPVRLGEIEDRVAGMSADELSDFRTGASQSAADLISRRATATGDVANIFRPDVEGGVAQRALDIAAQSPEAAQRARQALQGESQMSETYRSLGRMTQSRTATLEADMARAGDATVLGTIREALFPAGLTRETAEEMRALLARGDIDVQQLRRMVDQGVRAGVLEATPEQIERWFSIATRAQRAGTGVLMQD